jgi:hypothetical protein
MRRLAIIAAALVMVAVAASAQAANEFPDDPCKPAKVCTAWRKGQPGSLGGACVRWGTYLPPPSCMAKLPPPPIRARTGRTVVR